MQKLNREIAEIVGEAGLSHYQVTVLPGVFADFHKMLTGQTSNKVIKELYRMEDGKMEIELSGMKSGTEVRILDAKARRRR